MRLSKFNGIFVIVYAACLLLAAHNLLYAKTPVLNGRLTAKISLRGGEYNTNANNPDSAPETVVIIVGGRALTGPNSSPQQRDGRFFLPIASIARALGDVINVNALSRTVEVRRQTGTTADFSAENRQVRENGALVLVVSNASEIIFSPNAEELMLPIEIVAELFDAAIRFDQTAQAIFVTRGQTQAETVRTGARHSFWEIYQIDYEYNLNRYAFGSNQNLTLSAQGRIGDGRFTFLSNLSGGGQTDSTIFRNGTITFERRNGQKFTGGDFGTGTDLQFMSANVRGASAQISFGNARLTAFGGRSISGAFFPSPVDAELPAENPIIILPRRQFQYDTSIFGAYATTDVNKSGGSPLTLSSGVMRFSSPTRSGEMFAGSVRYGFGRVRLQGDAAIGKFSGFARNGNRTEGFGAAFDFSGSLQLLENVNVQARYAYTGAKFLTPQAGQHEPVKLAAGGITWQPKKWLAASLSGSAAKRPDDESQRYRFFTATVNLTPQNSLPNVFFSHTESRTPQTGNASFTLVNAVKNFSRGQISLNATRIKTTGAATLNAQIGGSFRINEFNTLEANQSFGSGGAFGGFANWQTSNLLSNRLSLSAGVAYNRSNNSSMTMSERFSANLRLPRQTSLQINYLQTSAGSTLLVSLRGSLLRKRRAETVFNAPISEINSYGSFSGRVYQDINLNGQYDAGVDQPQANVKVRVDGNRYVESDASGLFRIDGVKTGEHQIYLDLLSVRADLTLLDGSQQKAELFSGRDTTVDFRLVRTGRITGTIWLDANENGKIDNNEQPLADVRIVAGSRRDTLTDANGFFVIGDLAPGEHVILIDEKTLPEKTKSAVAPLTVKVLAGRETADINFSVIAIPAEVKRFTAKKSDN